MSETGLIFIFTLWTIIVFSFGFFISPRIGEEAIRKCEAELPRNQHCVITARPIQQT